MRLLIGEGVAQAVQRQITQSYIEQEADAAVDFRQDAGGNLGIVGIQFQMVEELL